MRLGTLDHIALNVASVDRSLVFYHEVLGLSTERLDDFREGRISFPSVRVNPETVIDLFPAGSRLSSDLHALNHFCFTLADGELPGLRDKLVQHEVEIVEEAAPRWGAQGWGPSMKVRDPDGNIVELKAPPESRSLS